MSDVDVENRGRIKGIRGQLITLSGIDCAGKTTQIDLLVDALRNQGLSVAEFWYRPGYSPELDTLRSWIRRRSPDTLPAPGRASVGREEAFSRAGVSQAWVAVALCDMALQYAVKLRTLLTMHDVVICDRYLADAALDFEMRFPDMEVPDSVWFHLVKSVCPQPDLNIVLTISHEEMLARMEIKQEPFPDPPETRDRRFDAYMALADSPGVEAIDAEQEIEQVHRDIISRLNFGA